MQVKSFAIWANAEKEQVPALVQSTLAWANENNLEVHLADRLKKYRHRFRCLILFYQKSTRC